MKSCVVSRSIQWSGKSTLPMFLLPPAIILFGGEVTAKQFISFKGQLKDYTGMKVLTSHTLNIPEISADISWLVPFKHLTPTKE